MADQKQGKSHKLARSRRNKNKYDRQWIRTAKNKLRRINRQHKLAKWPLLRGGTFKGPNGTSIYVVA